MTLTILHYLHTVSYVTKHSSTGGCTKVCMPNFSVKKKPLFEISHNHAKSTEMFKNLKYWRKMDVMLMVGLRLWLKIQIK